ncbi:LAQU0S01e10792g1_1 [Lachancea quebecensis]|uniref:LAQU0S01e10792g1_1 n=1 Tax=Lachancea quebecensis TaxID=1654605 RepID=A0A0P1KLR0_9SACH|nr:LAQU0S01e10792g1_1 [Lachancea quebecensis]
MSLQDLAPLVELFPGVSENKLRDTLKSAGGDAQIACSMILSEQETLHQMAEKSLSNISSDSAEAEVRENRHAQTFSEQSCLDKNHTNIRKGTVNLKKRIWRPVHSFTKDQSSRLELDQATSAKPNAWVSATDSIQDIIYYTKVTPKTAQKAFYKKTLNSARAIIDIICHYDEYAEDISGFRQPDDKLLEYRTPQRGIAKAGGRVQSSTGFAHKKKPVGTVLSAEWNEPATFSPRSENNYKYDSSSSEAKELNSIITSNPSLRAINPSFSKRALEFYEGDVEWTMLTLIFIFEKSCAQYTFMDVSSKAPSPNSLKNISKVSKDLVKPRGVVAEAVRFDPSCFASDENYDRALLILDGIFTLYTADLHGFLPYEAELVAERCLDVWWKKELAMREMNGQRLNQIKAINLAPFKIITGRGLHSVGGVSKVRIKVKKFLDTGLYAYAEEASYFVVEGKKRA